VKAFALTARHGILLLCVCTMRNLVDRKIEMIRKNVNRREERQKKMFFRVGTFSAEKCPI
jgi:hypothetical protein